MEGPRRRTGVTDRACSAAAQARGSGLRRDAGRVRDQQLSRNLRRETIEDRLALIRRLQRFSAEYPWSWTPQDLESFTSELRGGDSPAALSTVRGYQCAVRLFLEFASDPRYAWTSVCEQMFGTHPTQICFEWHTAQHSADSEGRPERRALTEAELQRLFDYADDRVAQARQSGNKGVVASLAGRHRLQGRLCLVPTTEGGRDAGPRATKGSAFRR
jgi:hypothetical protein